MTNADERPQSEADLRQRLSRFFDGADLGDKSSLAASLLTSAADGWPHVAMISAGELLVSAGGAARLATWSRSRTTANLRRDGHALLSVILEGHAIRARMTVTTVRDDGALTYFRGDIGPVEEDVAVYATGLAGPTFALIDPSGVLERWRTTVAKLQTL